MQQQITQAILIFSVAFFWADTLTAQDTLTFEIAIPISNASDDVEEWSNGVIDLGSSDLELIYDNTNGDQTVGLRFVNIPILQGTEVQEAYIQFTTDEETSSGFSKLTIAAEATGNATPFEATNFNVSNRSLTSAEVEWLPGGWYNPGEAAPNQKTWELKSVVQEIIDRPDWTAGNVLAFIIQGTGQRIAASYDLNPSQAPRLVLKAALPVADTLLSQVFINEIMPSNSQVSDEHGDTDDWLEIYNGGPNPIALGGLYLTDDPNNLKRWRVTALGNIPPSGFGMIWADGQPEQGGLHANFKLKSGGEFLALVQELNGDLYILDSLSFPAVPTNVSYGRKEDGGNEWVFFGEYSPNASNNGQLQYFNEQVIFSDVGGFYDNSVDLTMSTTDATAEIYYTLDGSIPTNSSFLYQNPIEIGATSLVQAKAFKPGFVSSSVTSEFYLIDEATEIAILNVQSKPENFWDDETGIYVHGTNGTLDYCDNVINNWNQDWERPCELSFYEPDGTQGFRVNAGMKIGGACSRNLKMKSLNFFMRNGDYGDELIDYKIFPNSDITEFRRIKIRNSGTDWNEMLFRDGMNQLILENTVDLDLMDYRPVRVYLNGEYWGIHGVREMYNKYYIESHHGVDPNNIDLLGDPYGPGSHVREGDFVAYDNMIDFIENNGLEDDAHFDAVREMIDFQQYLNYHITQIYMANYDWPGNNVRIWRDKNGGKFRWMLFDTDASTGWSSWGVNVGKADHNTLSHMLNDQNIGGVPGFPQWPNGPESTWLFRQMMKNENFRNELIQRTCTFRELIFAPQRVIPMVDSMENLLLPEMQRHITKWLGHNDLGSGTPSGGSVSKWQDYVQNFRSFYNNREFFIKSIFQSTLNLSGRYDLTFNYDAVTNGDIFIHENEMGIPFNYAGEYFKNVPIKIKVVPHPGYYFSHWLETGEASAEIEFIANADAVLTPIFTDTPVANKELNNDIKIEVFPNPVGDVFFIKIENRESENFDLRIYNSLGRIAFNEKVMLGGYRENKISIGHFPAGIYLIVLTRKNHEILTKIIVVE